MAQSGIITIVNNVIAHGPEIGFHVQVQVGGDYISGWATTARSSFTVDPIHVAGMMAVVAAKAANPNLKVGFTYEGTDGDTFKGVSDVRI